LAEHRPKQLGERQVPADDQAFPSLPLALKPVPHQLGKLAMLANCVEAGSEELIFTGARAERKTKWK
jgi:hypothetical protein